jgi:hydroxyacylglutathione hydrolase
MRMGDLNVTWIHGAEDCALTEDPPIQVHRFDPDTFILRQSKCSDPDASFEAPFMYLLIGRTRALLLDAGASESPDLFPLASRVRSLLSDHAATRGEPAVPLVVAHSHDHGDHVAGDEQFACMADVVAPGLPPLKKAFGLDPMPSENAVLDLGARLLDVMAIPGHHDTHIAAYDRNTGLLLTGDTVYPGLLVVNDWNRYRASIERLTAFAERNPVSLVLGAHIEMTNRAGEWFGRLQQHQPDEHVLELEPRHLYELHEALLAMGETPRVDRHDDFIIYPAGRRLPSLLP